MIHGEKGALKVWANSTGLDARGLPRPRHRHPDLEARRLPADPAQRGPLPDRAPLRGQRRARLPPRRQGPAAPRPRLRLRRRGPHAAGDLSGQAVCAEGGGRVPARSLSRSRISISTSSWVGPLGASGAFSVVSTSVARLVHRLDQQEDDPGDDQEVDDRGQEGAVAEGRGVLALAEGDLVGWRSRGRRRWRRSAG